VGGDFPGLDGGDANLAVTLNASQSPQENRAPGVSSLLLRLLPHPTHNQRSNFSNLAPETSPANATFTDFQLLKAF
jgi:hypothetical protein